GRVRARGGRVVKDGAVLGRAPDGAQALRRARQLPRPPAGVRDVKNSHTRILERKRTLPRNSTCKGERVTTGTRRRPKIRGQRSEVGGQFLTLATLNAFLVDSRRYRLWLLLTSDL